MSNRRATANAQRIDQVQNEMWHLNRRVDRLEKPYKYCITGSEHIEALYNQHVLGSAGGGWQAVKENFQLALRNDLCDALGLPFQLPLVRHGEDSDGDEAEKVRRRLWADTVETFTPNFCPAVIQNISPKPKWQDGVKRRLLAVFLVGVGQCAAEGCEEVYPVLRGNAQCK